MMGATIVVRDRRLGRPRVRPGVGAFGPVGSRHELESWLSDAGIEALEIDRRGVFAVFSGLRCDD
jgi:hypothetical protein